VPAFFPSSASTLYVSIPARFMDKCHMEMNERYRILGFEKGFEMERLSKLHAKVHSP
jgi:hypothetical protein